MALKKYSLAIGIVAMILLVIGTFMEGGSLVQKMLFVIGIKGIFIIKSE